MKQILAEGHRGYAAKYPENTMVGFKAALALPLDSIEFDIWLTKDKVPVLIHDGNCLRTCGVDVHVRDLTLAELKKLEAAYTQKFGDEFVGQGIKIPTFEELLAYCKENRPDIILGVEIKEYTESCVDLVVELLKKYGFYDTCFFYAFHCDTIKYLKKIGATGVMGYPDFKMKKFDDETYNHYDHLGLALAIVKSEIYPIYESKNLPIHIYCADTEADARLCIAKNPLLITANDPVPLLTVMGRL